MCGRYTLTATADIVESVFSARFPPGAEFAPRYNIAPTQPVLVLRALASGDSSQQGEREPRCFGWLQWGLVPSWARDPAIGSRMINSRSETAAEKPSFRASFRRRRCVIPADGFYEWARTGTGKQPYHIRRPDRRPFALAGLWDVWESPDGTALETCTILTTSPNAMMESIHARMPCILDEESLGDWLDPQQQDPSVLLPMLGPAPEGDLEAVKVDTYVNSARNEGSPCLDPPRTLFDMDN